MRVRGGAPLAARELRDRRAQGPQRQRDVDGVPLLEAEVQDNLRVAVRVHDGLGKSVVWGWVRAGQGFGLGRMLVRSPRVVEVSRVLGKATAYLSDAKTLASP